MERERAMMGLFLFLITTSNSNYNNHSLLNPHNPITITLFNVSSLSLSSDASKQHPSIHHSLTPTTAYSTSFAPNKLRKRVQISLILAMALPLLPRPRPSPLLLLALVASLHISTVHSQTDTDPGAGGCSIDPSVVLPTAFNTSSLTCRPVWNNFILRVCMQSFIFLNLNFTLNLESDRCRQNSYNLFGFCCAALVIKSC